MYGRIGIYFRPARPNRARRRAFTLVELLVVVAIIALLVSLITPSLKRARRLTLRAICLSNIHQQIQIQLAYATSYNGCFPRARRHDPQYVRSGGNTDGWWALTHRRFLTDSALLRCPILAGDLSWTHYAEYFDNMAWDHSGNYGGWDSAAANIWIPYVWILAHDFTPEPGEPPPIWRTSDGNPSAVIVTHRCSTAGGSVDWDMTHGGILNYEQGFENFTVEEQPLGFYDGHTEYRMHDDIRLRFTHTGSGGWNNGYVMYYHY